LIFTFTIIMLIIIFRIRKVVQGTKVNVKRTIIFSAYFLAITSFFVYNSFLIGGFPVAYVTPYFAIAIGAAYCSYWYSKRTLSFEKIPNGSAGNFTIYAKGGLSIYLIYTVALTIRIVINFLFIGSEKFFFSNQESVLANDTAIAVLPLLSTDPATTTLALVVTDTLLIVGTGLLLGRNTRILKYFYKEKQILR
jgi:hypothetical protein